MCETSRRRTPTGRLEPPTREAVEAGTPARSHSSQSGVLRLPRRSSGSSSASAAAAVPRTRSAPRDRLPRATGAAAKAGPAEPPLAALGAERMVRRFRATAHTPAPPWSTADREAAAACSSSPETPTRSRSARAVTPAARSSSAEGAAMDSDSATTASTRAAEAAMAVASRSTSACFVSVRRQSPAPAWSSPPAAAPGSRQQDSTGAVSAVPPALETVRPRPKHTSQSRRLPLRFQGREFRPIRLSPRRFESSAGRRSRRPA